MNIFIKRIIGFVFSTRLMVIIVLLFAISIAIATFVENDFGSSTARAVIYNAWWFNLLLFAGIINLCGVIISGRLYRKEKFTIFLFHFAFLLILTGAALKRFFSFEGYMHIRSGQSSNQVISSTSYLTITAHSQGTTESQSEPVYVSAITSNNPKVTVSPAGKKVTAECLQIIAGAVEKLTGHANGEPAVDLVVSNSNEGRKSIIVTQSQPRMIGDLLFTLNDTSNTSGVNINSFGEELTIRSSVNAVIMNMATGQADTLKNGVYANLQLLSLYNIGGHLIVPRQFSTSAIIDVTSSTEENSETLPDALLIRISSGSESQIIRYFAMENAYNQPAEINLNGMDIKVSFGARVITVPFELKLTEFILERYPGSQSPSWFESRIILTDRTEGISEEKRIYMNNVLKYKGYRFYQSSYDNDEQGTIFSVNHDYAGTWVSYAGYLMLAIGMVSSIFNRNSRFAKLSAELSDRKNAVIVPKTIRTFSAVLFFFMIHALSSANVPDSVIIGKQHAGEFGKMLIQDQAGRIKPINTLSSELLRKVYGKTLFNELTPDQVLLGMLVHPVYWQAVPMIRVKHPEIQDILQISGPYVSFMGVFDLNTESSPYKLSRFVNEAYQKKPASRTTFDTEIIRLDERVNLCYQIYSGALLRIFPKAGDSTFTWHSPSSVTGMFSGNDSVFVHSIIPLYLQSLNSGVHSQEAFPPEEALGAISSFQSKFGSELMPADFKVRLEILYNRINIFDRLASAYGIAGFIMLLFQFIVIFKPTVNLKLLLKVAAIFIYLVIGLHLSGLAARWIISGHAPWSNAYESLIFIAFATVLAGLVFSRKSPMTLSVTSLLAWLILFVAHMNWMDPEITNLVPVLKSYWLLIHVAVITASYGFLAMGALMAFLNLVMMISQTRRNMQVTNRIITEFSMVIEMTLTIGLYLLTIGTFLGGVWANESWGRYWGWDPKETWALVSILIYAFVSHMRLVPGLKGNYIFNLMSLLAFGTIIMTYFGVNYYLSGMHSYAKGDPLPVPPFVYYTLAIVILTAMLAWENQRRIKTTQKVPGE